MVTLLERLRSVPVLADLPDEQLAWLAEHGEWREFSPGEVVVTEGAPADMMLIILAGELQLRRRDSGDETLLHAYAGQVAGLLPFSRMTHSLGTARATVPTQILCIHREQFSEMRQRIPLLEQRLIAVMNDRVRETMLRTQQREKLVALGRLSAGLAHELNNPAAAVRRATTGLSEALRDAQVWTARLAERIGAAGIMSLNERLSTLSPADQLDLVSRSDREEEVASWLETRGAEEAWAPTFIEAGVDEAWLESLEAEPLSAELPDVLGWLEASLRARELLRVVERSAARISELVAAVKTYTYMDQAPLQEVDIHEGLESTLVILGHKLKGGVSVIREYAPDLPRISAYGSELNQVWTNVIDNAIDAMNGEGQLRVRTSREHDRVLVEIADNGPGIPPEIQTRIFEPFFTTKGVGEGTGLGLDIAYRIVVRRHHGDIQVVSQPGDTRFLVRLPIHQ